MTRTIHLHGRLGRIFGKTHKLHVATAAEAIRALHANFPGRFVEELKIGAYEVIRGQRKTGLRLDVEDLNGLNLGKGDLHIVPVPGGSAGGGAKGGGSLKIILGVVLVGAAIFFSGGTLAAPLAGLSTQVVAGLGITWGNIALVGLSATLLGLSSVLAPKDKPKQEVGRDESFSFSGPKSTNQQGNPIPLIYGLDVIVGSQPISFSSSTPRIATA